MGSNNVIPWNDIIKKEAIGKNNEDFGEIKDIQGNYIIIQRGIINKEIFYIPKDQVESYEGGCSSLRFKISEFDLKRKYQEEPFMKYAENDTLESDMNKLEDELDS
jgi:hypothetical protein